MARVPVRVTPIKDLQEQLADFDRSIRSMRDSTSIDRPLSWIGLRDRSNQKGSNSGSDEGITRCVIYASPALHCLCTV
jgi:hypothetical protein